MVVAFAPEIMELLANPTLTVAQAARVLGIGRNQAYEAVQTGQLPSIRIGSRILVPTAQLLSILQGGDA